MDDWTKRLLNRIFDYVEQSEKTNWRDSGQPDDHVYADTLRLREWLETIDNETIDPRPPESVLYFDIAHMIERKFSDFSDDQRDDFVGTMKELSKQLERRIEERKARAAV